MSEPEARLNELIAKLQERNCRITPQRRAVLKVLAASDGHPSVEQIYERIKPDFPTTSLATVYKTVTLLKEMGEVLELGFGDASSRYDGNKSYPHPHLICTHCGEIMDLETVALDAIPQAVMQETGYQIVSHRLDFYGICPDCQSSGVNDHD